MKLIQRFKRLKLWNQLNALGSLASIGGFPITLIALVLTIVFFALTYDCSPDPDEQIHGLLMPANDPDPPHRCKGIPPDACKIFLGGNLSWSIGSKQVIALRIDGYDMIRLTEGVGGYFLSAELFREDGRPVARIVNNQWQINPNNYFRLDRPDRHELNIYDKNDQRVLRVRYLNETTFVVEGVFHGPETKVVATLDELMVGYLYVSGNCKQYDCDGRTVFYEFGKGAADL